MSLQLILSLALAFFHFQTQAQAQKSTDSKRAVRSKVKPAKNQNQIIQISYGSNKWNLDSRKIDSAYLILIDKTSGRTVQVTLDETEPDSSLFKGNFSLRWEGASAMKPEIYVPPVSLRDSEKNYKKIYDLIQSKSLPMKLLVTKKGDRGQSVIEAYDTQEQANTAQAAYERQQQTVKQLRSAQKAAKGPSEQDLAAAALAEQKAKLEKAALEAAKRESDRVRLEQLEKQKNEERLRQAKMASEKEIAERKAKAKKLSDQALENYNKGEFVEAEKLFKDSVELDPANNQFYFQYGVTLYRNEKYNDSLVVLKLAKVDAALETEKTYYMALGHYRLNELKPALEAFNKVGASDHQLLKPSGVFYAGVIQFAEGKFEDAKKNFETVIDISTDPRMDEQAENYIDQIATQMMFKKMAESKWTLVGVLGMMYDSNVLLAPDNAGDQGSSTDKGDIRLLTVGSVDYRPVFKPNHEFSLNAAATLMNSGKNESAQADPYLYTFTAPYSYKGTLGKRGLKLTAKPGYELLFMDPDGTGSKVFILNSYLMLIEGTLVMSPSYFATYNAEYRVDDSRLAGSIGDNDTDANKYTARTIQTFFLDKARKESLAANIGYVMNTAKGKNRTYNRIETGVTYARPARWESTLNLGLAVYKLDFPDADPKRNDMNYTFTAGLTKPMKDWLVWGVAGSYTQNSSNQSLSYEYDRWSLTTTATFMNMF